MPNILSQNRNTTEQGDLDLANRLAYQNCVLFCWMDKCTSLKHLSGWICYKFKIKTSDWGRHWLFKFCKNQILIVVFVFIFSSYFFTLENSDESILFKGSQFIIFSGEKRGVTACMQ